MRAFLDRMMTQLREYFEKTSRGDKIRLAVISILVVVLAIVAVILLSRTKYDLLLDAQTMSQAGEVMQVLDDMGVPNKNDGTRVLVPEDRVNELRAKLSAQQIIGPGDTSLDILESAQGFGITDSQQRKLFEAQRAYEIRSQVLASEKIMNCLVIVNFGETSPFLNPQAVRDATCSVNLTTRGGVMLTRQEANTIAGIVMGSIPGIRAENIHISDSSLNQYIVTEVGEITDDEDFDAEIRFRIDLQHELSDQLRIQAEQLLTPIFGMSNVRVSASVSLNFDRIVIESVEFDPPVAGEVDGIVRSSSEVWERWRRDAAALGIPGTDSNGMGTVEYPYGTLDDGDTYGRAVNEKNYEINETRTLIERERGKIERLSIAVVINSDTIDEDYIEAVINTVSNGIGIPIENVSVERLPFPTPETVNDDEMASRLEDEEVRMRQRELIATVIMWGVILLLGLALMLLIRSIVKILHPPPPPPPPPEPLSESFGEEPGSRIDFVADDDDDITDLTEYEEDYDDSAEEDGVELNKKTTGLEQIEKFIDKDPASVAQLLRNWLSDEEE